MKFKLEAYEKEKLVDEKIFDTPQEAQEEAKRWWKEKENINLMKIKKVVG